MQLKLPFRNVQGGGQEWQTGYYSGNPLQLGVWAVPANQSIGLAQQSQANRLAAVSCLTELAPPGPVSFRFQVQPDGQWQVLIDFLNDGVVDIDVTSEQAGNVRHPFAGCFACCRD